MSLGLALHTHGRVSGANAPRIVKVLSPDENAGSALPPFWRAVLNDGSISAADPDAPFRADMLKLPEIVGSGDVIRLRGDTGMVSVLWRRSARTNSLFATDRCNSLCVMCSQPPRNEDDGWRVGQLLETIPLIDPDAAQLTITGGEPTLLGNGLTKVLQACGLYLPATKLQILTNGRTFRDPTAAAEWCAAADDRAVWAVPLYADIPEIHDQVVGAPGAFDDTLDGLYEMASNNARVEVRVVLHSMTVPRLGALASYIYRRLPFVEHVALMGLEPMGYAKRNRDQIWIDPADYVDELNAAVAYLANRGMAVSIYNLPLCILPRRMWPFARKSISEWKNTFPPECEPCVLKEQCSGFFASAGQAWRSRAVRPITKGELRHELA